MRSLKSIFLIFYFPSVVYQSSATVLHFFFFTLPTHVFSECAPSLNCSSLRGLETFFPLPSVPFLFPEGHIAQTLFHLIVLGLARNLLLTPSPTSRSACSFFFLARHEFWLHSFRSSPVVVCNRFLCSLSLLLFYKVWRNTFTCQRGFHLIRPTF